MSIGNFEIRRKSIIKRKLSHHVTAVALLTTFEHLLKKGTKFLTCLSLSLLSTYNNCLRFDLWQQQRQQQQHHHKCNFLLIILCPRQVCVPVKAGWEKGEKLSRKNVWTQINDSSLVITIWKDKKVKRKIFTFLRNRLVHIFASAMQ